MVLNHFGVPEFDAPDNYDTVTLRGDHILRFTIVLPDYNPDSNSTKDELIRKFL